MPYLSLTTWSLNENLGPLRWTRWDSEQEKQMVVVDEKAEKISLLDLPKLAYVKGFKALEVCHFHFPRTDEGYLTALKQAFDRSGTLFYNLLIDYGDISSSDEKRRQSDVEFIKDWIDIASRVGAERVRVIAGEASPTDRGALVRSLESLKELIQYGKKKKVRIVTENFQPLASTAENCLFLKENVGRDLGLVTDFGNYQLDNKYSQLEMTIPVSESIHAKPRYNENGELNEVEFCRSLDLLKKHNYEGPITLVAGGTKDQWEEIEQVKKIVKRYL
ncbi:sugar phosphate isomerase/epimerase family protein [Aquibacillus albus]|uniref:Sugar phosphate isomerase/epimerase n=1 Tax=Aquibacillus albus TaxID=1168171 RepID=A0ABS2MW75_9BACI|nr:TIM barrel protein [Aquibacillus albus]MBM7570137.1 sugar phosphate isomerase/epimerase [Aquibacillus albus]